MVDWRKDKGNIEDHKTFVDVSSLKVGTIKLQVSLMLMFHKHDAICIEF